MIISDLSYLETVAEVADVIGGTGVEVTIKAKQKAPVKGSSRVNVNQTQQLAAAIGDHSTAYNDNYTIQSNDNIHY